MRLRTLTALAVASVSLGVAPAALAQTNTVGNAHGTATMNICFAGFNCTYIEYQNGKPTDVVKRTGTLVSWSLNAGSEGGQVRLRVLRASAGGRFRAVHSSALKTVSMTGMNTFSAHISVKRGDVLALSNDSSGIYMATAPPGADVRYFSNPLSDGASGKPDRVSTQLRLLLSAHVKS